MNRLESWLLHGSTILLAATGFVYAWMHYLMKPLDPFSVVNHPLEPYLFSAHVIIAPLLVFGFGIILHSHILFKKGTGAQMGRKSGLVMIPTFALMVFSGYLLQIVTSDFRKTIVWIHLISGGIWSILYLSHQVISYRLRKKFRIPAQPVLVAALLVFAAAAQGEEALVREVYTMGTTLRLVLLESDHERALKQSEILIRAVEEADQQLSTWKEESEISRLNRQPVNEPFAASHQLIDLIVRVQMWSRETDRAFDPGIGTLLELWNVHGSFRIPGPREIQDALSSSGIAFLNLDSTHGSITKLKQIKIDPGAFGKGEGLQRAIEIAHEQNMAPLLLDFGGQIAVHGKPPGNNAWVVQLADPLLRDQVEKQGLFLKDGSFSTSGFSERSGKVNGRIINHIMDPRTGQPAPLFGSVTVWHRDALVADILSTALYVMGPTDGYKWASDHGIAAAFSSKNGVLKTLGFK